MIPPKSNAVVVQVERLSSVREFFLRIPSYFRAMFEGAIVMLFVSTLAFAYVNYTVIAHIISGENNQSNSSRVDGTTPSSTNGATGTQDEPTNPSDDPTTQPGATNEDVLSEEEPTAEPEENGPPRPPEGEGFPDPNEPPITDPGCEVDCGL